MKLPTRITLDNVKVWHAKNLSHWMSVKYYDQDTRKMVYCEKSLGVIDKNTDILQIVKSKILSLNTELDKGNSIKSKSMIQAAKTRKALKEVA